MSKEYRPGSGIVFFFLFDFDPVWYSDLFLEERKSDPVWYSDLFLEERKRAARFVCLSEQGSMTVMNHGIGYYF